MEALEEIPDTFKEINEHVIACTDITSCLISQGITSLVAECKWHTYHNENINSHENHVCHSCWLLHHGRDVLPTRDKSTTGNVALRFWVLVLGRSCNERLLSF